jgi:hypothetical protein
MSENIDINIAVIKEEVSINAANNLIQVNINSAPISIINPQNYDLSQFTNTSPNPFVQQSALGNYVPTSRTLTINGTTQDLSANRTFTIPTDLTIGTTPIASGTIGRVLFEGTGNVLQQSGNLFWDSTNNRLGIGTSTPSSQIDVFESNPIISTRIASTGIGKFNYLNSAGTSEFAGIHLNAFSGEMRMYTNTTYFPTFYSSNAERMRIATTGNVLINTTTDAGFNLDVNGTARVSGILSVSSATGGYAYLQDTSALASINVIAMQNAGGNFAILSRTSTGGYVADHYGIVVGSASNSYQRWMTSGSERMRIASTGNLLIGTTTDVGYKLDVNGIARVQSSVELSNNGIYKFGPLVGLYATTDNGLSSNSGAGNLFLGYYAAGDTGYIGTTVTLGRLSNVSLSAASGLQEMVRVTGNFAPTSGTALFNALQLNHTINQTGGANGITRGLYINPTLTAAADFRAIETTEGNVLFGSNFFWDNTNGRLGVGSSSPVSRLSVVDSTSTTASLTANALSHFNISRGTSGVTNLVFTISGVAPNTASIQHRHSNIDGIGYPIAINPLGGNVLIGTTTDAGFKLDVSGSIRATQYVYANDAFVGDNLISVGNTDLVLNKTTAYNILLNTSGSERMRVNSIGNVGIGTSTPAYTLDVYGSPRFYGDGNHMYISIFSGASNKDSKILFGNDSERFNVGLAASSNNFAINSSNGGTPTSININYTTGNVQIGTTTDSGFKLNVNGTARIGGVATLAAGAVFQGQSITQGFAIEFQSAASARFYNAANSLYASIFYDTNGLLFSGAAATFSSSVQAGGGSTNASAILQADSTTKGFLPPRGSNAQMLAIASPAAGLIFFDNTNNKLNCYDGTTWQPCW